MWISFPIGHGARVVVPWFLIPVLLPVMVAVWGVWFVCAAVAWAWRHTGPRKPKPERATVTIRIADRG